MIEVTERPLSAEAIIGLVKTAGSGCVVTYIGLIRDHSRGKPVLSVTYQDPEAAARTMLKKIADEIKQKWPVEKVAIYHRLGTLKVGDINLVVAIAAAHRREGFAACRYAVDRFKELMPARKTETYRDGSTLTG